MSIKIIKRGSLPEEATFHGTCGYCKTELVWKGVDGTKRYDQRDGDSNAVKCPVCKRDVYGSRKP